MNPYEPPAPIDQASILDGHGKSVVCPHCDTAFKGIPRKSFLGFQKHTCTVCKENFSYPLFKGYRITYYVLLVLMFGMSANAPEGRSPGLFFSLIVLAVLIDAYLVYQRK